MENPFSYNSDLSQFRIAKIENNSHWIHYSVEFPIAFPGIFKESNTSFGEYFKTNLSSKSPLVILIHGWGDHSTIPMHLLARKIAKTGIHCFLMYLPFHSRRLPVDMKKRSPNLTQDEWFAGYRIAITDVRQVIDWAEKQKEIDTQKIAVIGLSLGAFVSSIAMGIDNRIRAGVLIVCGGNSAKIQQLSRFAKFRKQYHFEKKEYEEYQESYTRYLKDIPILGWEKVEPARQSFLIDPLTYAYLLKERPILMLNALWDEFVPRETTLEFYNACGDCKLSWFPSTHPTIWLFYPLIARRIQRFLNGSFNSKKFN
jgi:pimeloyl-ACP methyl ester carboxylesterase